MRTIILGIETQADVKRRVRAAARSKVGKGRISFETVDDL